MNILIVGGSGGVGKSITPLLEARGYNVQAISSKDLNIKSDLAVELFLQEFKPHVILNLAASSIDNLLAKATYQQILEQINVNILGNTNLIRAFIQISKERKFGRYIYMSSILSEKPVAGAGIYSSCKAFNDHLIKVAAIENAKFGVTFNSIQLGYFPAGLCDRLPGNMLDGIISTIPLKRLAKSEELINLIDYFIKTEYATGTIVKLAGGL